MNHEDHLDFQQREEGESLTNRRKKNTINERTGILNLMRQIVDAIQPSRSGINNNSPIKMNGEVDITYEVVRYNIASKINVVWVEKDSVE